MMRMYLKYSGKVGYADHTAQTNENIEVDAVVDTAQV